MIHLKQQASSSSQSGFTIIESLVAIVVVGILLAAIAPVIVLSVATRVQARRVELATDAAQTYINGVSSGTIPPPPITTKSPNATTDPPLPDAPSGSLTCPTTGSGLCLISSATSTTSQLYCVDGDTEGCTNNNSKDMIVQAFGYNPTSNNTQDGYRLGLRVYRADAFNKTSITLQASKDPDIKQAQTFIGGTGLTSRQAPLVETTAEISNKVTTFNDFCARLKPPPSNPNPQSNC